MIVEVWRAMIVEVWRAMIVEVWRAMIVEVWRAMIDNINVLEENEMTKAANVAKGSKVISRQKTQIFVDVEKIMHDFINFS